jgi:hypothetical protein
VQRRVLRAVLGIHVGAFRDLRSRRYASLLRKKLNTGRLRHALVETSLPGALVGHEIESRQGAFLLKYI